MSQGSQCSGCGTALAADVPHGICPACALREGLKADSPEADEGQTIPDVAELAGLFPDLDILELIGRGGMGAVYKARQRSLDRLVALKIVSPGVSHDPTFAERFSREAKALARLNHRRIVTVYDSGEVGGLFYFLMEYVDGGSLRGLMAHGRPAPGQVLSIVAQICEGLQYAHDAGVIHRDIKPDNILLDRNLNVKIADFGIAKLAYELRLDMALTEPGTTVGTAYYMAPEQIMRPEDVDQRADIYSLGVVFYQLLTGELPVGRFAPPSHAAQVSGLVDEVVLKALERDPQQRFGRVEEVTTQLQQITSATAPAPASMQPQTLGEAGQVKVADAAAASTRKAVLAAVLLGAVVLATILGGVSVAVWMVFGRDKAPAAQTQAPTRTPKAWTGTRSPLMRAIGRSTEDVRQMIAEGYDVNERSRDGAGAPLHMAAMLGDRGFAAGQLLVEAGADVNATNNSSAMTPLMIAAANDGEKLATYLVAKGAQVNARDRLGRTALDFAEYHQHETIAALLKQSGATSGTGVRPTTRRTRSAAGPTTRDVFPLEVNPAQDGQPTNR